MRSLRRGALYQLQGFQHLSTLHGMQREQIVQSDQGDASQRAPSDRQVLYVRERRSAQEVARATLQ